MRILFIILCVLPFTFGVLNAASHYNFTCNGFEPSAINLAMGGSPVGAVNFWHNDPLNAYDNPAFPSLHEGLSYSETSYVYMNTDVQTGEDLEFQSSLYSASYHGIGLLIPPIFTQSPRYSSYVNYGGFDFVDEEEFYSTHYHLYDKSSTYGLSINLPDVYKLFRPKESAILKNIDLAIGMNIIHNESSIIPSYTIPTAKASSTNLGFLTRINHSRNSRLHLESAFGVSYFNAFNDSISYLDANKAARIYQRLNLGMSFSVNMENQYYNTGRGISACVENLYSARLLAGITEEFANDPMLLGLGGELGIFDTAFLRMGYHHDEAGNINGITYGIGINAHYRDLVSAVYNYSFFPGGSFNADKKVSNYSFSVNILGILKELNHEQ